jgi:hypothetical protein
MTDSSAVYFRSGGLVMLTVVDRGPMAHSRDTKLIERPRHRGRQLCIWGCQANVAQKSCEEGVGEGR